MLALLLPAAAVVVCGVLVGQAGISILNRRESTSYKVAFCSVLLAAGRGLVYVFNRMDPLALYLPMLFWMGVLLGYTFRKYGAKIF